MSYENRRATAVVRVRDAGGQPASGQKLHIELKNHDFLFGCGAFDALHPANDQRDDPFCRARVGK